MDKETELWGRKFRIVKNGLDQSDVISFVDSLKGPDADLDQRLDHLGSILSGLSDQQSDLISKLDPLESLRELAGTSGLGVNGGQLEQLDSQINKLTDGFRDLAFGLSSVDSPAGTEASDGIGTRNEKLAHLDSLTRLAESTVVQAEKEAEALRAEIEEEAQVSASAIVAEAEERAKAVEERIVSEAEETATVNAEGIVTEAEQVSQENIATAEERARQIICAAEEQAEQIQIQVMERAEADAELIRQEADELLARSKQLVEGEIKDMFDQAYRKLQSNLQGPAADPPASLDDHDADSGPSECEAAPVMDMGAEEPECETPCDEQKTMALQPECADDEPIDEASGEAQDQPALDEQAKMDSEGPLPEHEEATPEERPDQPACSQDQPALPDNPDLYEGTVELAIPPPVGLDQVMQLHKDLKDISEIQVMNFGGSVDKGITIRLVSRTPTPLLDILGGMTGVASAVDEAQAPEQLVPSRPPGNGPPIRRIVLTTEN